MDFVTILTYYKLGFEHVIPLGYDHILFILSLFFLNSNVKSVIIQCTAFTIAHSISLGLSATGYLIPNPSIIEPIIALSIVYTSIENIVHSTMNKGRIVVVFLFGLIHGMGFANALKEIGLPPLNFLSALFSFNIGVEIGQIAIVLAAYFLVGRWLSKKEWYQQRIVYPVSSLIACVALYWTIERIV